MTQALQQRGSPWCQPFTRGWLTWDVRYCLKYMFSNKNCTHFLIPPGWWKTPIFQYMCLVAPDDVKIWICNSESGNLISSGIKLGPPFCLMNQGNVGVFLLLFAINRVNSDPVYLVLVGSTVSLFLMQKIVVLNFLCLFWWLTHHFFVSCISSNESCSNRIASILLRGLRGNHRTVCFVSTLYILQKWNSGQK